MARGAALSDEAHKKNIVTTRDGYLEDLNKLRVVKYNWKEQDDTEPKELGLIAQEVEPFLPEVVRETKDENKIKSVAYGNMVGVLIEAIKELNAKIEELQHADKE